MRREREAVASPKPDPGRQCCYNFHYDFTNISDPAFVAKGPPNGLCFQPMGVEDTQEKLVGNFQDWVSIKEEMVGF